MAGESSLNLADILSGVGMNEAASPEELIPARMLNEFTYCPRLAYLEWVQGEFAENIEVAEGTFGHRRVDLESKKPVPAADDIPPQSLPPDMLAARALTLSAMSEGLIAKLDILELTGKVAIPVDYKRGSIPDVPGHAWEPERVQLCAQGLILRANGYQSPHGELYYIESRRRVTIPFDDALVTRTRELVSQLREQARTGAIPPPLVDSPKCPRCSLVGICLPDETNLLHQLQDLTHQLLTPTQPNRAPRQLLASRHEALPLYVQDQGAFVGKDGDRVVVKPREGKSVSVPFIDVSQVSLFGNVQMSSQLLRELAARNIPIGHFSYGGWFHAVTHGLSHKNIELRIAQFQQFQNPAQSLALAKAVIAAKVKNSRTMLRRHATDEHKADLDRLAELLQKIERAPTSETLLGLEGMAAKIYFAGFARILRGGEAFQFENRNRRPPTDPVNALLSFVYSLLIKDLTITLQTVGFDPFLGFYHRPRYGKPALALDLAEEFRPLVADSVVMTLINNEEVSANSFLSRAGSVALTEAGRKAVLGAYERRLESEITHPVFGYKLSYRRLLEVQARLLGRVLLGEITSYPGFCTR